MQLTRAEKERIADSRLKLQAVSRSLKGVDPNKVPDYQDIEECLQDAEKSLSALESRKSTK